MLNTCGVNVRDETSTHPGHPVYAARALVAGMQVRGPCTRIDAPDVQEAVIRRAEASQVLRVG